MLDLNTIYNMDCLEGMKLLPSNSIDAIVTDPPYWLSFMGKKWDYDVPSKEIREEALRVLKPWWYLLAFAGTRTYHRMACAIEDAGFEVRDMIEWVYGSGFPKSRNIGLDVDKRNGVTKNRGKAFVVAGQSGQRDKDTGGDLVSGSNTMGAYVAQNEWSGWGTALKPAHEPICMARKPLGEKTVAENVLKWGTGGINIDGCRVGTDNIKINNTELNTRFANFNTQDTIGQGYISKESIGRFPANLIHDGSDEVRECFPESKGGAFPKTHGSSGFVSPEEKESRLEMNDSGNASRFFKSIIYQAKSSKAERNKGCEELELRPGGSNAKGYTQDVKRGLDRNRPVTNNHPTVKPIALMEYLVKLVSKEWAVVIDPFAWSGSTMIACKRLWRQYIGFELDQWYCEIAENRVASY